MTRSPPELAPRFDIIADLDTPVSAFLKLRPLNPRYLLESVEGGTHQARFSLIGFGEVSEVVMPGPDRLYGADAVRSWMREAVAATPRFEHALSPEAGRFPFAGGLVGFTAYDLVRRLEPKLSSMRSAALPDMAAVSTRSCLVFDHVTRCIAVLHAGSSSEAAAIRLEVERLLRGPVPPTEAYRADVATPNLTHDEYCDRGQVVHEHILAGDVFQLVLSVAFDGEGAGDPFAVYRALRVLNPSPYLYYLDVAGVQVVGSSPEALVRVNGSLATLRPIAGTRPRGATVADDAALEQDLLSDEKEAAEHVMLVDLARNDLGRVAQPGTIRVEPYRSIERYSHVMHLVSGVTGELEPPFDAFDAFTSAFVAGTVVGAPKVRAMQIIDELEPEARGIYAGTIGTFGHGGRLDQAIAIRTITFSQGRYRYQAGAGIVADSVMSHEYAECKAKAAALAQALDRAGEVG